MKTYKLVLLGNAFVGKSSLILRLLENRFETLTESTIGAAFFVLKMPDMKLEIWDTSGQERYNSLIKMYYRKASVAFIVFDVNNKKSYEDVKKWIHDMRVNEPEAILFVFANKCDLDYKVNKIEYEDYFKQQNITCFTCSAKTGEGLDNIFKHVEKAIQEKPQLEIKRELMVVPEEPQPKRCCY